MKDLKPVGKPTLKFTTWNVYGSLEHKIRDNVFQNYIEHYDFISFVETKTNINSEIEIPNYSHFHSFRAKKHKNARAHSGGVVFYYKKIFMSMVLNVWEVVVKISFG